MVKCVHTKTIIKDMYNKNYPFYVLYVSIKINIKSVVDDSQIYLQIEEL